MCNRGTATIHAMNSHETAFTILDNYKVRMVILFCGCYDVKYEFDLVN